MPSFACTVTGTGVPENPGFGVNVTLPVAGSIVYVPTCCPSIFFVGIVVSATGFPSTTNFAGFVSLIVIEIFSFPDLKLGVPSCTAPWIPSEPAFVPTGLTGLIIGVYVVCTFTLFDPVACTVAGSTSPV